MFVELSDFAFLSLVDSEYFVFNQSNLRLPYIPTGNSIKKDLFVELSDSEFWNFIQTKTFVAFPDFLSDTTIVQRFNDMH